jgi:hypothetical protein
MTSILVMILLLHVSLEGESSETWLCSELASRKLGDLIQVCGVAVGADEPEAKLQALKNAQAEFKTLCQASSDCLGKAVLANPKRTSCEKTRDNKVECRRLLEFSYSHSDDSKAVDSFASVNGQTNRRKIEKGMSKKDVLLKFGKPFQITVLNLSKREYVFYWRDPSFCNSQPYNSCSAYINNDKVSHFDNFTPDVAGILDGD